MKEAVKDLETACYSISDLMQLMAGRTSFVIAHRLSTIQDADIVLVINEGKIHIFHNPFQMSSMSQIRANPIFLYLK